MANIVGKIILEQYRVDAFIASGGMGAVYRVWDVRRNVPLAMKVLHSNVEMEDAYAFQRFEREARALQKLTHPNIVSFYGIYKTMDFNFLLLRYVSGPTLKEVIRKSQSGIELPTTLIYFKALCAALGYAHQNGVVHCDVKPGNVMIDRSGTIYLTDFGIARHADSTATSFASGGTPAYMAPEQIKGASVSPETDIYALGIILFELLTGKRPFYGNEIASTASGVTANERIRHSHLSLPPPDPSELQPTIPQTVSKVILKALEKQPGNRFSSTAEFLEAVCAAAGIVPAAIPNRVELELPPEEILHLEGDAESTNQSKKSRKWVFALGFVGLLLLGGIIASLIGFTNLSTQALQPTSTAEVTLMPTLTETVMVTVQPVTDTPMPTPTYTNTPIPTATKEVKIYKVTVKIDGPYLYSGPDTVQYTKSEHPYKYGTEFVVLGRSKNSKWFKVRLVNNQSVVGWLMADWVLHPFPLDGIPFDN